MVVYAITVIIYILAIMNWVLSEILYKEPKNAAFFKNVTTINLVKEKYITANPRHVLVLSVLMGVFSGLYLGFANITNIDNTITVPALVVVFILYFMELTRTVSLKDGKLRLSRFLYIS